MTTYTATRAASTYPVKGMGLAGDVKIARGQYDFTANLLADDLIEFCRVPKGAVVLGGWYAITKVEVSTSGATFDMDIGWNNNGSDASDTDGFGNFGVPSFAAVTGYKPEATFALYPLGGVLRTAGPKTFAAETIIRGHIVASSTNFDSGSAFVEVYYEVP